LSVMVFSIASMRTHAWNAYEAAFLPMALFLIWTPGFGVQYMIAVVPFLFIIDLAAAIFYGIAGGFCLVLTYYHWWTGTIPPYSCFNGFMPLPAALFGLGAWMTLLYVSLRLIIDRKKNNADSATG